jgi:hypothetical protein
MKLDRLLCTFTLQDLLDRKEDINLTNDVERENQIVRREEGCEIQAED